MSNTFPGGQMFFQEVLSPHALPKSRDWVHVSLGLNLLIWRGGFQFNNRRDDYVYTSRRWCYPQSKSAFIKPLPNAGFLSNDWFV